MATLSSRNVSDQRMREFEGEPNRTEFAETRFGCRGELRVHQGLRIRMRIRNLMVIEHENINAFIAERLNDGVRGRAAVNREQQFDREFLQTVLDGFCAQSITFVEIGWEGSSELSIPVR